MAELSNIPSVDLTPTVTAPGVSTTEHHRSEIPSVDLSPTVTAPGVSVTDGPLSHVPRVADKLTATGPQSSVTRNKTSAVPSVDLAPTVTAPRCYVRSAAQTNIAVTLYLDGTDRSSLLTGALSLIEEERKSSVLSFRIIPSISLKARMPVAVTVDDGSSLRLLFVGHLTQYTPALDAGHVDCTASNDLQGKIRALSKEAILLFTGGHTHSEISDNRGDRWEWAQEVLESVPLDIHVDRTGSLTKADWAAKTTADHTFTNATRFADSLRGDLAQLGNIVNRNVVTVQHRFNRRKRRTLSVSWLLSAAASECQWVQYTFGLPTEGMVESALDATGWNWSKPVYTYPWGSAVGIPFGFDDPVILPAVVPYAQTADDGSVLYDGRNTGQGTLTGKRVRRRVWDCSDAVQGPDYVATFEADIIRGFSAKISKEWDQRQINNYVIDVKSTASIAELGEFGVEESWGLEEPTKTPAASDGGPVSLAAVGTSVAGGSVIDTGGGSISYEIEDGTELANGDWYFDEVYPETGLDELIEAAIARAQTEILSSHRQHTERFSIPLNNAVQLSDTVRITGMLTCQGKLRAITTSIDQEAGRADMELQVAISGLDAQGDDVPQPLVLAPAPVNDPLTEPAPIFMNDYIGGQISSPPKPTGVSGFFSDYEIEETPDVENPFAVDATRETYGTSIEIIAPEIAEADTSDNEQQIDKTVIVNVPVDEYTVNFSASCT